MALAHLPRPTSGRMFSAYLVCPHQAWLEYHGDVGRKLPPPGYLRAMQQEGHAHEKRVIEAHYPDATRIPERLPLEERVRRTTEAMKGGARAILQGCLAGPGEV